jgi:hypothetical protein
MFPLARVKAYRAYFSECRAAAKGTPEFNDLDTTVKLCDQLIAVMTDGQSSPAKTVKKPPAPPPAVKS